MNPLLANLAALKYLTKKSEHSAKSSRSLLIIILLIIGFTYLVFNFLILPAYGFYLDLKLSLRDDITLPTDQNSKLRVVNLSKHIDFKSDSVFKQVRGQYFILTGGVKVNVSYPRVALQDKKLNFEQVTESAYVGEACLAKIDMRFNQIKKKLQANKNNLNKYYSSITNEYNLSDKISLNELNGQHSFIESACDISEFSEYHGTTKQMSNSEFYAGNLDKIYEKNCYSLEESSNENPLKTCQISHKNGVTYYSSKYGFFEAKAYPFNKVQLESVIVDSKHPFVVLNLNYVPEKSYQLKYKNEKAVIPFDEVASSKETAEKENLLNEFAKLIKKDSSEFQIESGVWSNDCNDKYSEKFEFVPTQDGINYLSYEKDTLAFTGKITKFADSSADSVLYSMDKFNPNGATQTFFIKMRLGLNATTLQISDAFTKFANKQSVQLVKDSVYLVGESKGSTTEIYSKCQNILPTRNEALDEPVHIESENSVNKLDLKNCTATDKLLGQCRSY